MGIFSKKTNHQKVLNNTAHAVLELVNHLQLLIRFYPEGDGREVLQEYLNVSQNFLNRFSIPKENQ